MFQDAGFPEAKDGEFSARMADAIVVSGSADQVKARLRELPATYGVGELLAMPIVPPGDRDALPRTLQALGELAREG
jgi:alkanesulfonate monooxygenase SsuD/methylene tetrahydromethanopterin reductase-like flavin-dependent oxidoreductase (luciferase family)